MNKIVRSLILGFIVPFAFVVKTSYGGVKGFALPSNNADLSNLTLSSGTLSPAFATGTIAYTADVNNSTSSITVTPVKADAGASIQVRVNSGSYAAVTSGSASSVLALSVGSNTIDIKVTGGDGSTVKTYTITVKRSSLILDLDAGNSSSYPGTGTVWTDLSGNGNNAVLVNGPAFDSADQGAIQFDGSDDYVDVNNDADILSNTAYTKIVWVYITDLTKNNNIISGGDNPEGEHALWLGGTNKMQAGHNGDWNTVSGTTALSANKWYHAAVTYDDVNGWHLYLNGSLEGSNANTTTFTGPGNIYIGSYKGAGDVWNSLKGKIAVAKVYNSVLSASEILQDYNSSKSRFYSDNADLSGLSISTGSLSPSFASATTSYTASVSNSTTSITVTPTASESHATLTVNGTAATSGSAASVSLNEGVNTISVAVTAQDGTTTKTYTLTVLRQMVPPGNSLAFNSGQSVTTNAAGSAATNFGGSSSFTIEMWVKPNNFTNNPAVFGHKNQGSSSDGYSLFFLSPSRTLYLEGKSSGKGSSIALKSGQWSHIAVTFNYSGSGTSGTATFYINGEGAGGGTLDISSTGVSATLGAFSDGSYTFNGNIDEVKVWNTVRTQAQIKAGMTTAIDPSAESNLVLYYNFDEGTAGGTNTGLAMLYDQTSHEYNGTLNNFALTGTASNWSGSYAMTALVAANASSITTSGFTANWAAPVVASADSYLLDVSIDPAFNSFVSGYNSASVSGTSQTVSGLSPGTYYYRVRAVKGSETGSNSNIIRVKVIVPDASKILYVNKNVSGGNGSGNSWANAAPELADALKAAKELNDAAAGTVNEIWVAGGTYKPLYSPEDANFGNSANRDNAFLLVKYVKVYGGFAGTETALADRDLSITANRSTLSGDFNNDDNVTGSGSTLAITGNTENAYHVVVSAGDAGTALLDGFTITGGNANYIGDQVINSMHIGRNVGGGMSNVNSSPEVSQVSISGNTSSYGGGMHNNSSFPTLTDVSISGNSSNNGGGIFNLSSSPTLTNVSISGNKGDVGGGMYNNSSSPTLTNVSISGNTSIYGGGGMYNGSSSTVLTNVSITGNICNNGGGMYNYDSSLQIHNSIIWGNKKTDDTIDNLSNNNTTLVYTYSLIEGMAADAATHVLDGTITSASLFTDAANGDYTLKPASPAINAGDNSLIPSGITTDLAGNTRIQQATVDLGAYESPYVPIAPGAGGILYVNKNVSGSSQAGNSWTNALSELADALKAAKELNDAAAGTVKEIWTAKGTYKPLYRADNLDGSDPADRNNAFVLVNDVKVYGGFSGTETALADRSLNTANASILSGDFNNDDGLTGSGSTLTITGNTENAYHVVISAGDAGTALLDGFTIAGGNADGSSDITVNSTAFSQKFGGGMFNISSSPKLSHVIFNGNKAREGGGMFNLASSSLALNDVTVSNNEAVEHAGGIRNSTASAVFTNVIISGNKASGNGGGMYNASSSPVLTNISIIGNNAPNGGGMYNEWSSSPQIRNSIIWGNSNNNYNVLCD